MKAATTRLSLLALAMALSACAALEGDKIDYKSASRGSTLEVPPDLTQLSRDSRYALPGGSVSAAAMQAGQAAQPSGTANAAALQLGDVRIERDGNQRWLVVNRPADKLWEPVRDFWQESGFNLTVAEANVGIMETDWAENRAKLPQDFIRSTLGKFLDSLYSTGERDKFRTRLERNANGGTEIYITHQGMVETLTGADKTRATWTARPSDPDLEAEFLRRLMVRLGSSIERAKASVDRPQEVAGRAAVKRVTGSGAAGALQLTESFDRAWRSVGLAVDRGGFSVVDRDRSQGTYFVRYADPELGAPKEKGFFSRIFSFGSDNDAKTQPQYRIKLTGSGDATQIVVQNAQGGPETSRAGARILDVLADQLK